MNKLSLHNTIRMMLLCSLVVLWNVGEAVAQISPGDLTSAHAHLEGISNCTKCHVLGDKVTNEKCLDCHKEIKSRVDQGKGYHSSSEVAGKDCFACHSEHHGRKFEIVRFDADRFNHQQTGYKLTGAHVQQNCAACHKDERIESPDLRKKETTYLGLKTDCISCHKDVHQNTLSSKDCASCHNTEKFAPAALFDHAKTDFPLKGKHKEVDCRQCHELTFQNGALFQRFADVSFSSCVDCHEDVHKGQFGVDCKTCHTEESFGLFMGKSNFNHNQTKFPLQGKHKTIDCTSCHQTGGNVQADKVFQDYKYKDITTCVTCHEDVHESKLGIDCRSCHVEDGFQILLNRETFKHDLTGYPLAGKHAVVDCKLCHETKMIDPLPHDRCIDCHDDFHKGQFVRGTQTIDCRECHTEAGFMGSLYTVEQHNEGVFPLEGGHLATPCFSCHLKEEEWQFRKIGERCIDCHTDVHEGFLSEKYYPAKTCDQCHVPDAWSAVVFDHQQTAFELEGKHESISCVSCHTPDQGKPPEGVISFLGLTESCTACHENIHQQQFEIDGVTDCRRCHVFEAWAPSNFDHNTARFVLEGAHKEVNCRECHKEERIEGRAVVKYRLEKFECIDCHL